MNAAKIQLSAEESTLVQDAGWLLTKNTIIEKTVLLLNELTPSMQHMLQTAQQPLPLGVANLSPKIAKGEKYEGLPWVMLDFPRLFARDDIWAIRTFFWWGHFFSITLHLKGKYKQQYEAVLKENLPLLQQHEFYICIAGDEWQHHFREDNYIPLHQLDERATAAILSRNDFCKLSAKISLDQWNLVKGELLQFFQVLLKALGH